MHANGPKGYIARLRSQLAFDLTLSPVAQDLTLENTMTWMIENLHRHLLLMVPPEYFYDPRERGKIHAPRFP